MSSIPIHALVVYKGQAGQIINTDDKKVMVKLADEQLVKLRPKDVTFLHGGPVGNLGRLKLRKGEIQTAWELIKGSETDLRELAELIFGEFTPETAWSTYLTLEEQFYFEGSPDHIRALSEDELTDRRAKIEAKETRVAEWTAFIKRTEESQFLDGDEKFLQETEGLALGQSYSSKLLRDLGRLESQESAHALLLELSYWQEDKNPYPSRLGLSVKQPDIDLDQIRDEDRVDLTQMTALAIDDEGSTDPDDAVSYHEGNLWIHIADVSALVTPDSLADREARARGANLYLPEGTVNMLPPEATALLGLGLHEISPAISFRLDLDSSGEIIDLEFFPSLIKVTRLSYEQAEKMLLERPLVQIHSLTGIYQRKRIENGAIELDLPEVRVRINNGQVSIQPLKKLQSRDLVREAMLMVGEAVGRFALRNQLPMPFTTQDPPADGPHIGATTSQMFALRRFLRPSQQKSSPGPHAGLGLDCYVQTTSPLRRYLDLVVHQQLRTYLGHQEPLDDQALVQRSGAVDGVTRDIKMAERLSNQHWTLVYLLHHPEWKGEGIVVDHRGRQAVVLVPELGLETNIYQKSPLDLDSKVWLELADVDLPDLNARFRLVKRDIKD